MKKANDMKERNFKSFEGQPWNKMDEVLQQNKLTDYYELDIEPMDIVKRRLESFLEIFQHDIAQITQLQSNKLIVTHGEIFSALLELMLENSPCENNLSFSEFVYYSVELAMSINDSKLRAKEKSL